MTYRKLILATGTCTGLLIAAASLAMPINAPMPDVASAISLVDDDESDGDDNRQKLRLNDDDDISQASGKRDDDDEGGDDDDERDGRNGSMQPQNDTAPANGLFTPGAKPKVQLN
ncbi:MAG: hypothetical protein KL863_26830 [Rhizobium sp.]|nr:hypothetical protein [Rhizobium sp.]